jgi:hypothetical protein
MGNRAWRDHHLAGAALYRHLPRAGTAAGLIVELLAEPEVAMFFTVVPFESEGAGAWE